MNGRQIGRIARHEFVSTLRRRGVWLAMVGVPLLSLLLIAAGLCTDWAWRRRRGLP